jgi:exosortase B
VVGSVIFVFGLLCFIVGRALGIWVFEVGSQIPVLLGLILMFAGWQGARKLWMVLVFLCFVIPLPGFLIETLTGALKQHVAAIAQSSLFALGYPVARSGVVLSVGPYQLEVANACAGLHSMYSLTAIGLLYIYLMGHGSWLRNGILAASILPIAFFVNIVRVVALVLITYHFGDEAGQGFLHGFTGILLFAVGLGLLFLLDSLVGRMLPDRARAHV